MVKLTKCKSNQRFIPERNFDTDRCYCDSSPFLNDVHNEFYSFKEADLSFHWACFAHSSKIQWIYTFQEIVSIPFIKCIWNTKQITNENISIFKKKFIIIFKRFFRCSVGERFHCALMTL